LLPAATVYLTKPLIDSLVAAVKSGASADASHGLRPVLWWGGLMAALMLLSEVLREGAGWVRRNQSELLQDHIAELIYRQSIAADYAFYDLPEFYDQSGTHSQLVACGGYYAQSWKAQIKEVL